MYYLMNLGNISVLWVNLSRIHVLLHTPYYEYTIKACNPKPAKKEVVAIQTPAAKVIPLGLTSLFTTLSVYKCIMCKIVSFHPDYIYLTVRGEGK